MKFENEIREYARLAVLKGVNIQKDQYLVINCPIECAYFARMMAETAYDAGAKEVVVKYKDEKLQKIKYEKTDVDVLCDIPDFHTESYMYYARQNAAFISIASEDPGIFKGIDGDKIAKVSKANSVAMKSYYDLSMSNAVRWCVVSAPSKAWADIVFPESENSVDLLWEAILKTVRAFDGDIIKAWEIHSDSIQKNAAYLNKMQFKSMHYKNSLGTDLTVGLPKNHIWGGAKEIAKDGVGFLPNLPTEEVFSAPDRNNVNGKLFSALPLNYNGNLIRDFYFEFKDGRIVDFDAKEGKEILGKLINTDEGTHYLGEIALVPFNSPISRMGILFYNTLFDENASCHFALGGAYPSCIENGENYTKEELISHGANYSLEHVDFMVGTDDLEITALTYDNEEIKIFENGNFVI